MATYSPVVDEISDATEFDTSIEFKQQEQRSQVSPTASEERVKGRF
jgi:hypothetical protein